MRLLVVTHNTEVSGAEVALERIVDLLDWPAFDVHAALPNEGPLFHRLASGGRCRVHLVTAPRRLTGLKKRGVPQQLLGWATLPWHSLMLVYRLRRLILRERIDLVLCSSIKADFYGGLAAAAAGRRSVWYVHDYVDRHYFPAWLRWAIGIAGATLPACILANSRASAEALVRLGIPSARVKVAYYPAPRQKEANAELDVRKELGLPRTARLVTLVGRFTPSKGQREFTEAARVLCTRVPDAVFLLVGDSVFGKLDESYRDEVLDLIRQSGSADRIRWLGARRDAAAILARSDVAVMNSLWPEGFGLVVAEAMWAGVPVVGTALGGTAELLVHDETGLVVEPGAIAQLAAAIERVLAESERARRLAAAARARVAAIQSDDVIRRLESRLHEALGLVTARS